MNEQSLTPEYRAQLEAASLVPTNVGGRDVVLTLDEPAAPGYRAYITDETYRNMPTNLETDEIRILVYPERSTEHSIYVAARGRDGLLAWHKENVGISQDGPAPMPIAKLLGLVTSNAILQALQADVQLEQEEAAAPRA